MISALKSQSAAGLDSEPTLSKMRFGTKITGWILAALLVALAIFPDWFGGEYFRLSVLLAAFGTLTLWVLIVIFFSWVFRVCGSWTRLARRAK
jgi:hypothetical protein